MSNVQMIEQVNNGFELPSLTSPDTFINAMRYAGTAVTVVTTGEGEERCGATVSAMCSLTAEPAAVMVCVYNDSRTADAIKENGYFCVNILSEDQKDVAQIFAGMLKPESGDRFGEHNWSIGNTGSPYLENSVSVFDCVVDQQISYGTHTVFIGAVVMAQTSENNPLFYCNRQFLKGTSV